MDAAQILDELFMLRNRVKLLEAQVEQAAAGGPAPLAGGAREPDLRPLEAFVGGSYIHVWPGKHHWWNQNTQQIESQSLYEDGTNTWHLLTASTIYVKRVYNSGGTATVTLVRTTDTEATVLAGVTSTEARFVLATFAAASGEGLVVRRTGDIEEYRVA